MNILQHAEAVFALAVGVTVGAGAMLGGAPRSASHATVHEVTIATPSNMAVIAVPARRLTAVQKIRSLEDERALARAAGVPRS